MAILKHTNIVAAFPDGREIRGKIMGFPETTKQTLLHIFIEGGPSYIINMLMVESIHLDPVFEEDKK